MDSMIYIPECGLRIVDSREYCRLLNVGDTLWIVGYRLQDVVGTLWIVGKDCRTWIARRQQLREREGQACGHRQVRVRKGRVCGHCRVRVREGQACGH